MMRTVMHLKFEDSNRYLVVSQDKDVGLVIYKEICSVFKKKISFDEAKLKSGLLEPVGLSMLYDKDRRVIFIKNNAWDLDTTIEYDLNNQRNKRPLDFIMYLIEISKILKKNDLNAFYRTSFAGASKLLTLHAGTPIELEQNLSGLYFDVNNPHMVYEFTDGKLSIIMENRP